MKKLFTILFCLLVIAASAEEIKMALLQPRVAEGSEPCKAIELNMIRGELRKAFGWQSEFQVLTRTDVDAMLKEHGFQQTGMVDDNQRKQVGIMTGAQYICVSTVTKEGTQLYIESYLVDIETGVMTNPATQFANVQNNDYSTLQEPCNQLAKEMLGELGGHKKSSGVMAKKSSQVPAGYVDLGLPSGTLWKTKNEACRIITYYQAYDSFGNNLPTKEQWEELKNNCLWTWQGNGFKVQGENEESIFLPAEGYRNFKGNLYGVGKAGEYWLFSSMHRDCSYYGYCYPLHNQAEIGTNCRSPKECRSIRLVKNKE